MIQDNQVPDQLPKQTLNIKYQFGSHSVQPGDIFLKACAISKNKTKKESGFHCGFNKPKDN
jgi:hypothetical protein